MDIDKAMRAVYDGLPKEEKEMVDYKATTGRVQSEKFVNGIWELVHQDQKLGEGCFVPLMGNIAENIIQTIGESTKVTIELLPTFPLELLKCRAMKADFILNHLEEAIKKAKEENNKNLFNDNRKIN